MDIKVGKKYYFYDERAEHSVCVAHVLGVMPHPEREDDRLIVYRWYGKHKQRWFYGVTDGQTQGIWTDFCQKVVKKHNNFEKLPLLI